MSSEPVAVVKLLRPSVKPVLEGARRAQLAGRVEREELFQYTFSDFLPGLVSNVSAPSL